MTIELKFFTTDGKMFDTRREANTHQRTVDARGMMVNLITQAFMAEDRDDDPVRDELITDMLYAHKDAITQLLKGKPVTSPDVNPVDMEATAEAAQQEAAQQDADDAAALSAGDNDPTDGVVTLAS